MITTRRQFFGLAAGASILGAAGGHPELAVISHLGADHPLILSQISQLLENGVYFRALEKPGSLEGFKAVLFDAPALQATISDPRERRRLESWVRKGGFVFRIDHPAGAVARDGFNPRLLFDVVTSHTVHYMLTQASLTPFHPAMKSFLLERPVARMFAELKSETLENLGSGAAAGKAALKEMGRWGEYTLHYWKAAKALVDTGEHDDVRSALIASIRRASRNFQPHIHHDRVAGYFAKAWLFEQTGERQPLEKASAMLDEVINRRPRVMGVLTGSGYSDDVLALHGKEPGRTEIDMSATTDRRETVWTEQLHMHSASFASISRVTGNPKYLNEALRTFDHIVRYHVRRDGLLAHCTRRDKQVAGAWARGQSHALYGSLYILEELRPSHPHFPKIVLFLSQVGKALMNHQDSATGLWRNVIDNPSARLESSGSIGITCVYARCIREGWLDRATFEPMVWKSWEGLRQLYWRRGMAANCRGSGAGIHDSYYLSRPQGWAKMPHMLLAAVEMQRLRSG